MCALEKEKGDEKRERGKERNAQSSRRGNYMYIPMLQARDERKSFGEMTTFGEIFFWKKIIQEHIISVYNNWRTQKHFTNKVWCNASTINRRRKINQAKLHKTGIYTRPLVQQLQMLSLSAGRFCVYIPAASYLWVSRGTILLSATLVYYIPAQLVLATALRAFHCCLRFFGSFLFLSLFLSSTKTSCAKFFRPHGKAIFVPLRHEREREKWFMVLRIILLCKRRPPDIYKLLWNYSEFSV